jgi:GNAT superfamily N-acetyltransferase
MAFDKSPDVRFGVPADAERIFALMVAAHEEQGEHVLSSDKVWQRIGAATHRQGSLIGVIGAPNSELFGYVLMTVDPIWYSDDYQLLEMSNFVHADHRRSTYAKQLISFAKSCADDLGVNLVMGVFSNIRTEAKCRLYGRQLEKVGEFFVHRHVKTETKAVA